MVTRARIFSAALGVLSLVAAQAPLWAGTPEPLGTLDLLAGPYACGTADCYDVSVTCAQLVEPAAATLRVDGPHPAATPKGTILFTTGDGGEGFWGDVFGTPAATALRRLRQGGFRTVELSWVDRWLDAAPGVVEGHVKLACRPATVGQWVYDTLHETGPDRAFCASGNSGGASQIAYMITHYGQASLLAALVPTGGPPTSRMDLGCLEGPPFHGFPTAYSLDSAERIDAGFGFYDGTGPCINHNAAFEPAFDTASLNDLPPDQYVFPQTLVWFVFGALDTSVARGQGLLFRSRLLNSGTPLIGMSVAPNTPHATPSTNEGANRIRLVLEEGCVPSP